MPRPAHSSFRNSCGIWIRMPAPSPAMGSAPTAPRCSRFSRMASASLISWWDLPPLRLAMKPTPQASYSRLGSKSPLARGRSTRSGACAAPLVGFVSIVITRRLSAISRRHKSFPLRAPCPFPTAGAVNLVMRGAERDRSSGQHPLPYRRLPDRTAIPHCNIGRRGPCGRSPPQLRGLAQPEGRLSPKRAAVARGLPQVKDSIADLIPACKGDLRRSQTF